MGAGAWAFATIAMLLAFAAVVVAGQAFVRSNDAKDAAAAVTGTAVSLSEFTIDPSIIAVDEGGSLTVTNDGTVAHNLEIKGTGLKTPDIAPGSSERLDLSSLEPGMYTAFCAIAGHADAGMTAMLHVGLGGRHQRQGARGLERPARRRAEEAGRRLRRAAHERRQHRRASGRRSLAPKVLADGTKEFDLTAAITDWEVSPGKIVQAWTYNGTVPGPTIKVQPGDHVRVVLDNQLPQSTAIHFHGIDVPNAMDGVPVRDPGPGEAGREVHLRLRRPRARRSGCTTRTTTPSTRCPTA